MATLHGSRGRFREAAECRIRLGAARLKAGHWEKAAAAFNAAVEQHPEPFESRLAVASVLCAHHRWADAVPHFEWLVEHQGDDHFHTYRLGLLYLVQGDIAGYRRTCRVMLDRYADYTEPYVAERAAKLIAASDAGHTDELRRRALDLAERTVEGGADDVNLGWYRLAAAAARLRDGDGERALSYLERDAATQNPALLPNVTALFALTHARTGNPDAARAWLTEARTALDAMGEPGEMKDANSWQDWITADLWVRETESVLAQPPVEP